MGHSQAELLELELPITSKLVDKSLQEIKFPKGALVASIINDDLVVIASGQSVLRAGDRVFVYAQPGALGSIQKLFLRG
jgi:trk system potassium uptake protein TrkA